MADIVFQPTFVHQEFVDGPDGDRVRADEPNGFNARFVAIESDLRQLSTVVDEIRTAVDARGTGPVQRVLNLPPILLPVVEQSSAWSITATGAASGLSGSTGLMDLALPDNVQILSFRAIGQVPSGSPGIISMSLTRVPIGGGTTDVLASMTANTDPFDTTTATDPALSTTATATFRYVIHAAVGSTAIEVTIAGFQIVYLTS
nr:hypothetical protein OG999_11265 [Streptomyces sp. NBC_00886]